MTKLLDKIHIVKPSDIKLFTTIARMHRNTVIMCMGDILTLQSDMSCFRVKKLIFSGNYVRQAVLFKSGSGNEVELIGER